MRLFAVIPSEAMWGILPDFQFNPADTIRIDTLKNPSFSFPN